ncbi:MAG: InlB B-repeat-containing protein [Treponema sp.]|jgi:hypothetical protein|nr:InlB B-repeat-containing protein [Treponema sp.]
MRKIVSLVFFLGFVLMLFGCDANQDATYKVTYLGNGQTSGFPPVDNKTYTIGEEAVILSGNTLLKNEKSFKNWNTKADGSGNDFMVHDKITVNGAVFLYAIYED